MKVKVVISTIEILIMLLSTLSIQLYCLYNQRQYAKKTLIIVNAIFENIINTLTQHHDTIRLGTFRKTKDVNIISSTKIAQLRKNVNE